MRDKNLVFLRIKMLLKPTLVFAMLMIPILTMILLANINLDEDTKINIGIAFENKDIEKQYKEKLFYYSYDTINFVIYDTEEELKGNIYNYNADCGYYFTSLINENIKDSILLYTTPTTTTSKIMNLFISTIVVQNRSGELASKVLKPYLEEDSDIIKEEVLNKALEYTKEGSMIEIEYIDISKGSFAESKNPPRVDKILLGIIACMSVFFSIISSELLINERKKEVFNRIKLADKGMKKYYSSYSISIFLINFIYLTISNILVNIVYKTSFSGMNIFVMNIILSIGLSLIFILLGKKVKTDKYILSIGIFAFLFTILFSEMIFPLKDVMRIAEPIKYLNLVFYYIKGLEI